MFLFVFAVVIKKTITKIKLHGYYNYLYIDLPFLDSL